MNDTQDNQPGMSFGIDYGPGNPNNCRVHIRAIVDEEWAACRSWSYRRQRWQYYMKSLSYFDMVNGDGHMKNIKRPA